MQLSRPQEGHGACLVHSLCEESQEIGGGGQLEVLPSRMCIGFHSNIPFIFIWVIFLSHHSIFIHLF